MTLAMETTTDETGRVTEERWPVPLEEAWLQAFLTDMFDNHYRDLCFGPIIEGAAYEMRPPGKPERISLNDGYLTVFYGTGGHFHLCIGRNEGALKSGGEALAARRRPGSAEIVRSLDRDGDPIMWSFRMKNGAGDPMLSLFFPSPFITADDRLAEAPDWARLSTWDHVRETWIGAPDDGRDRQGKGFRAS